MYVAVDIGGTKTLLATFTEDGKLTQSIKFPTNDDYQQFLQDLKGQADSLTEKQFSAGATGVAAVLDREKDLLVICGNLPWKNEHLKSDLEAIFNCPFTVENDAKAGGLGEAMLVINDYKKVLFVTIGTGIGTTYIMNGKIDLGLGDGGGRAMMIEYEDKIQPWEEFASGTAIVKRYGKRAADITDQATWQQIVEAFSLGFLDLLGVVNPEVIIIGGGVGSHFDRFGDLLESELKKYQTELLQIPPLRPAQNPEEAVIYGCYHLAKDHDRTT